MHDLDPVRSPDDERWRNLKATPPHGQFPLSVPLETNIPFPPCSGLAASYFEKCLPQPPTRTMRSSVRLRAIGSGAAAD